MNQSSEETSRSYGRALLGLALVAYGLTVLRHAWVSDDAYITLRTVDNFLQGFGLRWNIHERVQTFTHPLWLFLLIPVYGITGESFYSLILLSFAVSVATLWIVARSAKSIWHGLLVSVLALLSPSFIDFSTSGLENPATHLLFALMCWFFLSEKSEGRFWKITLIFGLALLTRFDNLWLFGPVFVFEFTHFYKDNGWKKSLKTSTIALTPMLGWCVFALTYYGFLLPNTAYAKLNTGIPKLELVYQGLLYHLDFLLNDPVGALATCTALCLVWSWRDSKLKLIAFGAILHMLYVAWVGGDFMSGRLFTVPLFAALIIFSRMPMRLESVPGGGLGFLLIPLALSLVSPNSTLRTESIKKLALNKSISKTGIADERSFYRHGSSLSAAKRLAMMPNVNDTQIGRRASASGSSVFITWSAGNIGFQAGPYVHHIDECALTDGLLARLPSRRDVDWRVGHYARVIPNGYEKTLKTGKNLIKDKGVGSLYSDLRKVTHDSLWSWERWGLIVSMNLGFYEYSGIDYERYRLPGLVRVKAFKVWKAKNPGTPQKDPGNLLFDDSGVDVIFSKVRHAATLETTLDGNDTYRLLYFRGYEVVGESLARNRFSTGLTEFLISVPDSAKESGYNRVRVLPVEGDDEYALGHLRVK